MKNLCTYHILEGLCEGLIRFSGTSRAALLFAEKKDDPMRVYDPQNLLRGHEPKLADLYIDSDRWRQNSLPLDDLKLFGQIYPEKNLGLAGLISFGGRTSSIFYQMWFTEHHPDMCSIGPTERWLEHAVCLLAHDFSHEDAFYLGTSRYVLREYATHAVRDHIRDEMNMRFGWDNELEIYPILDTILTLSDMREEGAWPRGVLAFVEPGSLGDVEFMVRFPELEQPRVKAVKHVRKLIQAVEGSERKLISDGRHIVGVASGMLPECRITAEFMGGHGFLEFAGTPVASFANGGFRSTSGRPNLVQLEEMLLGSGLGASAHTLFRIVTSIVEKAGDLKHGCSLVVDLNDPPVELAGQKMDRTLDLQDPRYLDLAKSLSKVDGALHIGADLRLHAFACLLDGHTIPAEDRARGARFNSALRFTAEHDNLIVVVVSSDRPVSVIHGGIELTALCDWAPVSLSIGAPPLLEDWLKEGD